MCHGLYMIASDAVESLLFLRGSYSSSPGEQSFHIYHHESAIILTTFFCANTDSQNLPIEATPT